jgi:hypothetical protein
MGYNEKANGSTTDTPSLSGSGLHWRNFSAQSSARTTAQPSANCTAPASVQHSASVPFFSAQPIGAKFCAVSATHFCKPFLYLCHFSFMEPLLYHFDTILSNSLSLCCISPDSAPTSVPKIGDVNCIGAFFVPPSVRMTA